VGAIPRQLALESRSGGPQTLGAYEATLAFFRYNFHVEPGMYERTVAAQESAVEAEPRYALAWAQLAEMYVDAHQLGFPGREDALDLAHDHAHRAVDLDPLCQQAHTTLAYTHFALGRFEQAINAAERAIELNPNSSYQVATAAFWLGLSGELDRGRRLIEEAERLNPHGPGWLRLVPLLCHLQREDLAAALEEALRFRSPTLAWGPLLRASMAALTGDRGLASASY
jgi:tetratricopeptide (TPR) repeat protein